VSTVKVSELPVLASADAADEFVVVDDSAGVTKKITQAGLADFGSNTLTAAGITLGASTLDVYEEGTFSPFYEPASGAFGGGFSYLRQEGNYVRVGDFAFVTLRLVTSNVDLGTAGGRLKVSGLPFAFSGVSAPPSTIALGGSAIWASNAPTMAQSTEDTNSLNIGRDTTTNLVSTNVSDLNTGGAFENNVQISIFGLIS